MRLLDVKTINEMAKKQASSKTSTNNGGVVDSIEGPISKEQLEEWLEEYDIDFDEYTITNGKVNILATLDLDASDELITQIPVPLGEIDGDLNASVKSLSSFNNFPHAVTEGFFCYDTNIASFDQLEISVGGDVDLLMNPKLVDFRGIHRHIKQMNGVLRFNIDNVKNGGVGVLLIKGVKEIDTGNKDMNKIFNKYLKNRDIFDAQEHFIDAGAVHLARI